MILEGMHIYFNIIASKFTIWLLYLSLLSSFLRGTFLIQVHLQMYWESSPLIAIFFHSFLHFSLCFVLITLYLLICLKSELRSCSSACSWAVLLCKLAQDNFFFLKKSTLQTAHCSLATLTARLIVEVINLRLLTRYKTGREASWKAVL